MGQLSRVVWSLSGARREWEIRTEAEQIRSERYEAAKRERDPGAGRPISDKLAKEAENEYSEPSGSRLAGD